MKNITVIGSISMDLIVKSHRRPAVGETITGEELIYSPGGKGANQAVATAKLGVKTHMIGSIGQDELASALLKNLSTYQIDTKGVKQVSASSGVAIIQLVEGDNSITYIPGANNALTIADIQANHEQLLASDMVIIQNEIDLEVIKYIIDYCHENDIALLYNPAPALSIDEEYIQKVTYFTPNESEFQLLFKEQKLDDVLAQYPNKMIVTLGSQGAIFNNGAENVMVPSYKVEQPVDTTGAGDCFNGAFAVARVNDLAMEEAIKFANLASSIAIMKVGAQQGNPSIEDMKESENYENQWNFE